jgi:8-oxo-dGTP pyrophosphatase MutT (NUDIX family)
MIEKWDKLDSTPQGHFAVFDVRKDHTRSPESGREHAFYIIESPDWVNVIPLTPDGQVVCVRQYRHGTEEVTLEVPGGVVDPEDNDPAQAARRELREETGYDSDDLIPLGAVAPNPAIQDNQCHIFLARNVRCNGNQALDGAEEIDVTLVDVNDVPALITDGQITHSLVVVAFYLFDQHRRTGERSERLDV